MVRHSMAVSFAGAAGASKVSSTRKRSFIDAAFRYPFRMRCIPHMVRGSMAVTFAGVAGDRNVSRPEIVCLSTWRFVTRFVCVVFHTWCGVRWRCRLPGLRVPATYQVPEIVRLSTRRFVTRFDCVAFHTWCGIRWLRRLPGLRATTRDRPYECGGDIVRHVMGGASYECGGAWCGM